MEGPFNVPHVLIGPDQSHMQDYEADLNSTDIENINEMLCSLDVVTGTCAQAQTIVA
jgi:hypothetical protein